MQKLTVHNTPEFNGVVERLNRMLLKRAWAMLHAFGLPRSLWGEAVAHACWIKNCSTTHALDGMTPYKALHGRKPDISQLREWGCPVWVHDTSGSKLDACARKGQWVGVDLQSPGGHQVYWPAMRSVTVKRSVYFDDVMAPLAVPFEGESEDTPGAIESAPAPVINNKERLTETVELPELSNKPVKPVCTCNKVPLPAPTLASTRARREVQLSTYVQHIERGEGTASARTPVAVGVPVNATMAGVMANKECGDETGGVEAALAAIGAKGTKPWTIQEARRQADAEKWEDAVQAELESLEANSTWSVVKRPDGANVVGSKWVFKLKQTETGKVEKYKAQLVVQGYMQVPGINYFDTFAPVAKMSLTRAILAVAAANGWLVDQMDVKSAYLNGVLLDDKVIFMHTPPSFEFAAPGQPDCVLQLKKALYGLKQSSRLWYKTFCDALKWHGLM
jgi:hypothetical protein